MTRRARLLDLWDVDGDVRTTLPFDRGIALVNLRRIELACLLEGGTELVALAMGLRLRMMWIAIPACFLLIPAARLLRSASLRVQQGFTLAVIAFGLLIKQWGAAELAMRGPISAGYSTTLLTLTLLLIIPPRSFALLVGGGLVTYIAFLWRVPLSPAAWAVTVVNTAIVSLIALVAGALIFNARRSDHDQRLLIRRQNEQLRAQNDELDQLMAITAHDLRSPLYGLRNLFDLAARRAEGEPELPLRVMREGMFSLDAMLALVTRLLTAHAAEHRPLTHRVEDDLRGSLIAAGRRIVPQAQAAGVGIDLDLPERPVCAIFDSEALEQILDNLLGNAVRFAPSGTAVRLACSAGARAQIVVADRGPGVDPAHQAGLFGKFHRVPGSRRSEKAGTGFGLFISATLAERMNAALRYRTAEEGGAIFELSLPIA